MKKEKNLNKKNSVYSYLGSTYVNIFIYLGISLLSMVLLVVIYFALKNVIPIIILGVIGLFFLIIATVEIIRMGKKVKNTIYGPVLPLVDSNLNKLTQNKKNLYALENKENFIEYERINKMFEALKNKYDSQTFITSDISYESIPLEYIDKEQGIVSYDSLMKNIEKVVGSSKHYMNALINIHYDVTEKVQNKILRAKLNKVLAGISYPLRLAAVDNERKGFVVYVPCFDSIRQLEEEIEYLIKDLSIIGKHNYEKKITSANVAVVIYPYSSVENIVVDLVKASKSKKAINIYLPNKELGMNDNLLDAGRNINSITQVIEQASALDARHEYREANQKTVSKLISLMRDYYAFDGAGIVLYNESHKQYRLEFSYGEMFFRNDEAVDPTFIANLDIHRDYNGSYYFSNRNHSHSDIAGFLDYYHIASGEFFPLTISGKVNGVLYFLNKDKEIYYDSYLKENLFIFGSLICSYISKVASESNAEVASKRFKDVLRFSSTMLYSVDKDDYTLSYVSDSLRQEIKAEIGEKCYKALYKKDKPCAKCPLVTLKHMVDVLGKHKYDSRVVFKSSDDQLAHIALVPLAKDDVSLDRFDHDYLIPSSKSLIDALTNEYITSNNGYLSFFMICNFDELLKEHKEQGYMDIQKKYLEELEKEGFSMYYIKANVFALIAPNADAGKIAKIIQQVHMISKANGLDVCYLCKSYPGSSSNANELFKASNKLVTGFKFNEHVNEICIPEEKYFRLADHDEYILDIITKGVEGQSLGVNYTPVLMNSDRLIHAVEMTLNAKDPYTKEAVNNSEALDLLSKEGKIGYLTLGYLSMLDKVLGKYGYGFFVSNNVSNVIIHTDFSFFKPENFEVIKSLITSHQLSKGFIRLEIFERDLNEHLEEYKPMLKLAKEAGASLSVGRYIAFYLKQNELASMGVDEVKIDTSLSGIVNGSQEALDKVLDLWKVAVKSHLKVAFEGIINREQSELIHLDEADSKVQGNYFFEPVEIEEFIKVVKARNGTEDKFNT